LDLTFNRLAMLQPKDSKALPVTAAGSLIVSKRLHEGT
jgi:hypothetical protein